jgi:hypothetical protein
VSQPRASPFIATPGRHDSDAENCSGVWFNKDTIANILSLAKVKVKERYPVLCDSTDGNHFVVGQPHKAVIFKQSKSVMYYHDTENRDVVMDNTMKENREGFTEREYQEAKQARRALGLVGYPSTKDSTNMVLSNMILNFPVTPSNIKATHKIFGPNIASLKEKTTRNTPEPVLTDYVDIPKEIMSLNKNVTVTADVMFLDGIRFFISVASKLKFATSEYVPRKTKPLLGQIIKKNPQSLHCSRFQHHNGSDGQIIRSPER